MSLVIRRKVTLGVVIGSRAFFSPAPCKAARDDVLAQLAGGLAGLGHHRVDHELVLLGVLLEPDPSPLPGVAADQLVEPVETISQRVSEILGVRVSTTPPHAEFPAHDAGERGTRLRPDGRGGESPQGRGVAPAPTRSAREPVS